MEDNLMTINEQAQYLFRQAQWWGRLNRIWSNLTGKSSHMVDLAEVMASETITTRHYGGIQVIPICQILGSEGRTGDFDRRFYPLQEHTKNRWLGVALALLKGTVLPPVRLIQVGEIYFVEDGHHRISVARALGQTYVDAEVVVWEVARCSASRPSLSSPCASEPTVCRCAC
jgi:hypothetical protein